MRITNLEIENFRGIKNANISFPMDTRLVCLIGAGDSTKSTVLKAIEWILWPSWNLAANDNDFYACDTSSSIVLRGTFTEIPAKLLSEEKFGLYLRRSNVSLSDDCVDDPNDNEPKCLTVQLTINESLEPKWEVVCNRKEPRNISNQDRKLLSVGNIGGNCAKDMVWGKFSVLQKFAEAKGILRDGNIRALRDAASGADFSKLDIIGEKLIEVSRLYGIDDISSIQNRMLLQNGSLSTSVGLFDGEIPLNQRGTGSQRLLSMGLNIQANNSNVILLIDEVESGLEPYRLRNLLNELKRNHHSASQVIMTTHSPVAVAECTIDDVHIVQSINGKTKISRLKSDEKNVNDTIQAQLRKNAEAFLSKRLILCEGKTEIGFIRALDSFLADDKKIRIACKGVHTADGEGSSIFKCAEIFHGCGYKICLLMDSDRECENKNKDEIKSLGIEIFDWDSQNSFEDQIFFDVNTDIAEKMLKIAVDEKGLDSVKFQLSINGIQSEVTIDGKITPKMDQITKRKIGNIAKKESWFKRIDLGESVGNIIFSHWDDLQPESRLKKVVDDLIKWVTSNDG